MSEKKSKLSYKERFKQYDVEKQHMERARKQAEINAAYDDDGKYTGGEEGHGELSKAELVGEWEQLRRHAKVHFPEGADFVEITAPQKLVAVATVLGWSQSKISKASGIPKRTVARWLSPKDCPQIVYFSEQFAVKEGKKSVEDIQKENLYRVQKFISDVMMDKTDDLAAKRLKFDVGKYNYETVHGKPGQTIEHKGIDLKSIYQAMATVEVSDEDESEVFEQEQLH